MDGTVRITINQEDIAEFHEWLKRVKAIKACHIDDEPIDGCYHARIIADIPHQKGRIATYSAAEIVRMHDADSLSFGAISERLGCCALLSGFRLRLRGTCRCSARRPCG